MPKSEHDERAPWTVKCGFAAWAVSLAVAVITGWTWIVLAGSAVCAAAIAVNALVIERAAARRERGGDL